MNGRKEILVTLGFVLSVSLLSCVVTALLVSWHDSRHTYALLNAVCTEVLEQEPEADRIISSVLKEYTSGDGNHVEKGDGLSEFGYRQQDLAALSYRQNAFCTAVGFFLGGALFAVTFWYRNQKEAMRIQALTGYLEQVNLGKAAVFSSSGEDDFARLEDEIYKTVTGLYETRDAAVQVKNDFAKNLSNIAHQVKTPLTAVSLSVQMMEQNPDSQYQRHHLGQIHKQLSRLFRLEEALLLLSRLDSGTLVFRKDKVDVFTLLVLAADNLSELFADAGISAEIPELGELAVTADLEWTMEAVINLMKNCMEHAAGGTIHCFYAQNPLYTEILIWDEGKGFAKEDLPHLFERFYRGQDAKEGGIGIGLALAKEIMERQNGTIRAKNRPEGGACFEIRFYSNIIRKQIRGNGDGSLGHR